MFMYLIYCSIFKLFVIINSCFIHIFMITDLILIFHIIFDTNRKQVIKYLTDIFQNMNDYYRIRYDIKWHQ